MGIRVIGGVVGRKEMRATLKAMKPEQRGRVVRRSLNELALDLQTLVRTQFLSGPSPKRLERRTGRTVRSIVIDRAGLPNGFIEVGSLAELWWLQNYEVFGGKRGRRPFMRPAFNKIAPTANVVFARNWQREIDKA